MRLVEETRPEQAAELIALVAENPGEAIKRLAEACGMPRETAAYLVNRLESRYQPVGEAVERVTTASLTKLIEEKLPLLLNAIDQKKVDDATLRDIAVAFGVLAEKRQLLKGEPTQILTYEERSNINDLLPAVLKEAKRRGMVVDAEFHTVPEVTVSNPDKLPDAALSKTAAAKDRRDAKNRR